MKVALGASDDVLTDNALTTTTPVTDGLPRGRWFRLKLETDYTLHTFVVSIDGLPKASGSLGPRPTTPQTLVLHVGVLPSGAFASVTAHHDDLRMTAP